MKILPAPGLDNGLRQLIVDPGSFLALSFDARGLAVNSSPTLLRPTWSQLLAWRTQLSALTDTAFLLRTGGAKMGLFGAPAAEDVQPLFAAAALEWSVIKDPVEKAMFSGLAMLLIHPLGDGNGRLARWVWFSQLGAVGWDVQMRWQMLAGVFARQRNDFIAAVALARRGQPGAVYRLLQAAAAG